MKLPEIAINNRQFVLLVFFIMVIVGISSFLRMPRTEDPPLDIPGASIFVIYPGGNAADLEELILNPMEESINELEDIKLISSTVMDGMVALSVEFSFSTNAKDKFDEVVRQINSIRGDLPQDIYDLRFMQWSSTDVIMLQLALVSGTSSLNRMNRQAEILKKELEKVSGLSRVEIFGFPEEEIRISLDMSKMALYKISASELTDAIKSNNVNIPGGQLKLNNRTFNVKTSGSYKSLREIENTVVSSFNGSLVYLRDLADVSYDNADYDYRARFNGQTAVFITVKQKEGLNIFRINDEIEPVINEFKAGLDPDIRLHTVFSQVESVDKRVNGFFNNLLQGMVLVGLVIFLSLGFRASLLVILAIPLSIIIGLGWIDLYGFGLQQISIAALVIALGLLVDNSIVITENIERFIKTGKPVRDASIEATSQLGWPVVTATLTTMLAFIPIIAMPDKSGKFIQSLPVTVILTLFASLLIALSLTPILATGFMKRSKYGKGTWFRRIINRIIEGPYRKTLLFSLKRRGWVISIAVMALLASLILFTEVGVSFFPKAEKPQFLVRIQLAEGSGMDNTEKVCRDIEAVLDTISLVESYASNIGHGNPRIYYNAVPRQYDTNFAEILVNLKSYEPGGFDSLLDFLRKSFQYYPGARIFVREFEQGTPIEAPLTIKITGDDLKILKELSGKLTALVENTPGVINTENNLDRESTELWFNINREKANMLGVPVHVIDMTIRTAIAGSRISGFNNNVGDDFDIVMRLPVENIADFSQMERIYVKSLSGEMIPLKHLVNIEFQQSPGIISHYNLMRNATITADVEKGYSLDEIVKELDQEFSGLDWPQSYNYRFTGEIESRNESFGGMERAGIIAVIAILALMILQFRSLRQAFIVFSAIPLALIGSVIALYLTGFSFSFTAFIGLISLIGIVINNSIILVDYTNILYSEKENIDEAIIEAGETRFTPIILTTLTTVGGLLPLTLKGGTLWAPMGWTIIGGLLVSTFLTLLIVPVLYSLFSRKKGNPENTAELKS